LAGENYASTEVMIDCINDGGAILLFFLLQSMREANLF
jgi:hypothetical protein